MKTWRVPRADALTACKLADEAPAALGPRQVRVRLRATSINFRDLMVLNGLYPVFDEGAAGAGLRRRRRRDRDRHRPSRASGTGDRVVTCFFPNWVEGRVTPAQDRRRAGRRRRRHVLRGDRARRGRAGACPGPPRLRAGDDADLRRRHRLERAVRQRRPAPGRHRAAARHRRRFDLGAAAREGGRARA